MISVLGNTQASIQQAINSLENMVQQLSAVAVKDIYMTVDAGSPGIPHGAVVGMTGNSTVDLADLAHGWAGVNAGGAVTAGQIIQVRGGAPAEATFGVDAGVVAGTIFYVDPTDTGIYNTVSPGPGAIPVGIIYDATGFNPAVGGTAKVLLNSNFAGGVAEPPIG